MPAVLDAEAVAAVTRACDRHMEEWGPKTQPDFPINFYANRYTPLLSDPALQALPSHPAVLTAAVQLLRSVVRACRASRARLQRLSSLSDSDRPLCLSAKADASVSL